MISLKKNYNEYLISGDDIGTTIIWDMSNKYNIKYKIKTDNTIYTDYRIYRCLFDFNNNYIILSHKVIVDVRMVIYSLNNGKLLKILIVLMT